MTAVQDGYWFFTSPHDPVLVRRGDPLGFRLAADSFADLLVPDLSNRSVDARWFALLSWALSNAVRGWRHYDDRDVAVTPGRDRQAARRLYAWIRPLELLWVARTLKLKGEDARGRQLPGQRAVRRWLEEQSDSDFGLSTDQQVRYRQTGAYGGYRVALWRLPGLTVGGDGWQPGGVGEQLAEIVDQRIGWRRPRFDKVKRRSVDGSDFWLRHWEDWADGDGDDFFPERSDRVRRLAGDEAKAIRRVMFGGEDPGTPGQQTNQRRRTQVADILGRSTAETHADLCEELVDGLGDLPDDSRRRLALLPTLTRLADAGIDAMDSVWAALGDDLRLPLADLARDAALRESLDQLKKRASEFEAAASDGTPGVEAAERLVRSLKPASHPTQTLSALVEHHQSSGGGMRWFIPDGEHLTRNAPSSRGGRVSYYRFRLWGLARLAVQCGQINAMPLAVVGADDPDAPSGEEE